MTSRRSGRPVARARATSTNTITVPGFRFAGVSCGIKKSNKKDLALIFSERPANAAAIFTTNRFKAAPVLIGLKRMRSGVIQAVVVTSGNANACTGARGVRDAEAACREVGRRLGIDSNLVFPSSTGVIGVPLPMANVREGIRKAAENLSPDQFSQAAEAIRTTDRLVKIVSASFRVKGKKLTLAGMVKGGGMIAPHMATMLAYILTDAAVERSCLREILKRNVDKTFNCTTVDGDMSTNDTTLLLANGLAGNAAIQRGGREAATFARALYEVLKDLAVKLVADGEGATKVAEIQVRGARSCGDARKVAWTVANSQLVKTAFFGADPNFGRILAAIGYSGVAVRPERVSLAFDGVVVARRGAGVGSNERAAARVLERPKFTVRIFLGQGKESASVWTSDLGHDYVRINSAYRRDAT
jgi:glutamate N-acetyltransferase/amino-acid N-acetyltransferase